MVEAIQIITHNTCYYEEVDNITQTAIYKTAWQYAYKGMCSN